MKEHGAEKGQVFEYREIVAQVLISMLQENMYDGNHMSRGGAIAYMGALYLKEQSGLILNIAENLQEDRYVRKVAIETLRHLKVKESLNGLIGLLNDFDPVLRERSVYAIGHIGGKDVLPILKRKLECEENPEVIRRINNAVYYIINGKYPEQNDTMSYEKQFLKQGENRIRSIGRHERSAPQTKPIIEKDESSGGKDLVRSKELDKKPLFLTSNTIGYKVFETCENGNQKILLNGYQLSKYIKRQNSKAKCFIQDAHSVLIELPKNTLNETGTKLPIEFLLTENHPFKLPHFFEGLPFMPVLYTIDTLEGQIWSKQKFTLRIRFNLQDVKKNSLLKLTIQMPGSVWEDRIFEINPQEAMAGEKFIPGWCIQTAGRIKIKAKLYNEHGSADSLCNELVSLPHNPISCWVNPSSENPASGRGPAHYNATENKYYCYADVEIYNGFPFRVIVGPNCNCNVSDAALGDLDNFNFNIGQITIDANSSVRFGVYMTFGGRTYNLFQQYADVRIRLRFDTTVGATEDSSVWAAMAQIKLALNFVGNLDSIWGTFQSIVEKEASTIFEQNDFFIAETGVFFIPSYNPDWSRFRDIQMNDNKSHDCTSGANEADDLRSRWSSPTSWLDVWIVETLSGPACSANIGGFSPVNGTTDKNSSNSGIIIDLSGNIMNDRDLLGLVVAHELGHFLGLNHDSTGGNFMSPVANVASTIFTYPQYQTIVKHGFVERSAI